METTIQLRVTCLDIRDGRYADPYACAIAQAAMRQFRAANVYVTAVEIVIDGERFATPSEAKKFIRKFDTREHVKPITLDLVGSVPDCGPGWEVVPGDRPARTTFRLELPRRGAVLAMARLLLPELFPEEDGTCAGLPAGETVVVAANEATPGLPRP